MTDRNAGPAIRVVRAREHNLRDVSLAIPHGRITAFTGVSGSGKSSLVFDVIAAESQRQLHETFPAFVRHRLPQLGRPDVDALENLTVAVVIDQNPFGGNARSTVGTATDIAPALRLLFSRVGRPSVGYSNVFSFNDPAGMCPECAGLGTVQRIDVGELLDERLSLNEGAIRFPTYAPGTVYWKRYVHAGLFDPDKPLHRYTERERDLLLHAEDVKLPDPPAEWPPSSPYVGILPRFRRRYLTSDAPRDRRVHAAEFDRVVRSGPCPACAGDRLNPRVLRCRIAGHSVADLSRMQVDRLLPVVEQVRDRSVAPVVEAVATGLRHLTAIGLGYLSLDRVTSSLSGGEAQRVKMVRHLGSSLTGLTYVLDEPTVGLHPADVHRLAALLTRLRDAGNTVLVVEHDPALIGLADHVVDLGPGAGADGGRVVFTGSVAGLRRAATATGRHLRAVRRLTGRRRTPDPDRAVRVEHASGHNLRDVTVTVPGGVLTVVTGVAGSGKSTLVRDELRRRRPDAVLVDQRPIRAGRRSTPSSYLGVGDRIREVFAAANGVAPSWFSANSAGACPTCHGLGVLTTDLAHLDDVTVVCEACRGTRFTDAVLRHTYRGRTIADVLDTAATAARDLFGDGHPEIAAALGRMVDVGLGYLRLGQGLDTLSGGERQRLRLARQLADPADLILLDEPTAGLHGRDVGHLLALVDRLVDDRGATLVVVEHDLDVVAHADWIIDLGPGAGADGGTVTFCGTPDQLLRTRHNATATHLRRHLRRRG
jgi:excinuclease UvrABC ATPase subunit